MLKEGFGVEKYVIDLPSSFRVYFKKFRLLLIADERNKPPNKGPA